MTLVVLSAWCCFQWQLIYNCVVPRATKVSIFYDPMIAKLVVWDTDRTSALRRLNASLGHYQVPVAFPPRVQKKRKK
jgi:biotin carboxylase